MGKSASQILFDMEDELSALIAEGKYFSVADMYRFLDMAETMPRYTRLNY